MESWLWFFFDDNKIFSHPAKCFVFSTVYPHTFLVSTGSSMITCIVNEDSESNSDVVEEDISDMPDG